MEKFDILRDMAERTGGEVYIGGVGPVRSGKSTFIRRFMELLVLPHIEDPHDRERAVDALPQAGAGRLVMTTEPKFIPDDAVEVTLRENITMKVRMVDCPGYPIPGALGYEEDGLPRMVQTPWVEEPIPFPEAAELGTRKVVTEHSTLALVITTDGSIVDLPRSAYAEPEARLVSELKELGKPFLVVLNSTRPDDPATRELAGELEAAYDVSVVPVNAAAMDLDDIYLVMEQALYEFPVTEVTVKLPRWVEELGREHWLYRRFAETVEEVIPGVRRVRDVDTCITRLRESDLVADVNLESLELGTGRAALDLTAREELFYRVLEEMSGYGMEGKHDLVRAMKELVHAKREYDKVAEGLQELWQTGYGVVPPRFEDMKFDEPQLIRQGNRFGVRLRAAAPSIHMIRADVTTEITPVIGTEKQSEELLRSLLVQFEDEPQKIWQAHLFGKSLEQLVREGMQSKLYRMPEHAQAKLQETLTRIVNEGTGGLICIIL
ncbi:MAG: stage IV sporulation protein A [Bacillota bacterium]